MERNSLRRILSVLVLVLLAMTASAEEEPSARPKIGLALSGGGARGTAHVGVLKALEELKVPVDFIAGTSMGSMVAGLYAVGMTADELEDLMITSDWQFLMRDQPSRVLLSFRRRQEDRELLTDLEFGLGWLDLKVPIGIKTGQKLMLLLRSLTLPVAHTRDFNQLPIPFKAVATDIESGEMVVIDSGDMATAIRASMAVPGMLTPVELNGRLLIDGGSTRNLPVDIVRSMGADIVIAVDISAPLKNRENLDSATAITSQTIGLLTRLNVEAILPEADLVVIPEVSHVGITDFSDVPSTILEGQTKAREHTSKLQEWALDAEAYAAHLAARRPRLEAPRSVTGVDIVGLDRVDERVIRPLISVEPGQPIDLDAVTLDLARIYGLGDFESVDYRVEPEGDGARIIYELGEKSWGPNHLRIGFMINSDRHERTRFKILASLNATRLNPLGAEWRSDLEFGRQQRVFTEIYQPLLYSGRLFVAPRAEISRSREDIYDGSSRVADVEILDGQYGLDLGLNIGHSAELRLGALRGQRDFSLDTGTLPQRLSSLFDGDVLRAGLRALLRIDSLDSVRFPSQGSAVRLEYFRSSDDLGADQTYSKLSLGATAVANVGRHRFLLTADVGSALGDQIPFYDQYRLGGFLSMSGYGQWELSGSYMAIVRPTYYMHLADYGSTKLYVGGWLEAGNTWAVSSDVSTSDLKYAATLMIGVDSVIGPAYFAVAAADDSRLQIYLTVGHTF